VLFGTPKSAGRASARRTGGSLQNLVDPLQRLYLRLELLDARGLPSGDASQRGRPKDGPAVAAVTQSRADLMRTAEIMSLAHARPRNASQGADLRKRRKVPSPRTDDLRTWEPLFWFVRTPADSRGLPRTVAASE